MISYSQNFEDILLERAFRHKERGFYIDVGANDPEELSITKKFYDKGWSGINIEPHPECFKRLVALRPRDVNVHCAVSDKSGTAVLYKVEGNIADGTLASALSTLDENVAKSARDKLELSYTEERVLVQTLKHVCETYCDLHMPIDFLKIDVEGHEKYVLAGGDFSKFRPKIIIVESTVPTVKPLWVDGEEEYALWDNFEPFILSNNYSFVYFDGLNRFYIAHECEDLRRAFSMPVGIFDGISPKVFQENCHLQQEVMLLKQNCECAQNSNVELNERIATLEREHEDALKALQCALEDSKNTVSTLTEMNVLQQREYAVAQESQNQEHAKALALLQCRVDDAANVYRVLSERHAAQQQAVESATSGVHAVRSTLDGVVQENRTLEEAFSCQARENVLLRVLVAEERYRLRKHPLRSCVAALVQRGNALPSNFQEQPLPCAPSKRLEELVRKCAELDNNLQSCPPALAWQGAEPDAHRVLQSEGVEELPCANAVGDVWSDAVLPWSSDAFAANEHPSLVACPEPGQRLHALDCLWQYEYGRVIAQTQYLPSVEVWQAEGETLQQKSIYFPFMAKGVLQYRCDSGSQLSTLLQGNIALAHYEDDSFTPFLDWCMATATPICVNRGTTIAEKLGAAYPLYMHSYETAQHLVKDKPRVLDAHKYLMEHFAQSNAALRASPEGESQDVSAVLPAIVVSVPPAVVMTPENIADFAYAKTKNCLALLEHYETAFKLKCDYFDCDKIKLFQDLHVVAFIEQNIPRGSRILDVGGGSSRVLQYFADSYECWCIDAYEGVGNGPQNLPEVSWRIVQDYMGNFNSLVPNDYFDFVFSISVMEHLPGDGSTVLDVYADINRVLKNGGLSFHTVDVLEKKEGMWFHPFIQMQNKVAATRITPIHNKKIMQNDDNIWFMSKKIYEDTWKPVTKVDYENFGKPSFVNILWRRNY